MTPSALLAALLLAAAPASAAPAPAAPPAAVSPAVSPSAGGAVEDTRVVPPGAAGPPVRVERRLLAKSGRLVLTGGPTYLARADYYVNVGLLASGAYYFSEAGGPEVRLGAFFSGLSSAGQEVFGATGLLPDAHRPAALLTGGWRHTLGFGKVLLGGNGDGTGTLVHFDVQASGHVGLTFTDRSVSPTALVGPGLLMRFGPMFHAQLDVPLSAAFEQRSTGVFAVGFLPTLTLGVML